MKTIPWTILGWLLGALAASSDAPARAGDWPTYRHDVARSGITTEKLPLPLSSAWVFKSPWAPRPAWGDPRPERTEGILELRRNHFDDVFEVVAANGALFFGSSADNKVYCRDAASGSFRWTVNTGGPVRLAPTIVGDRLYVGSDDGWVRCLKTADGSLVWKFHAAPDDRRVLGHGKMISLWPVRTGVLVDRGAAYFGAGVFPAEGVFMYAVDADTGREIWRNDASGESPQSWVSPQGYLLASPTSLYAPMGRVSPAALDRATGKLKLLPYFGKAVGGTYALLADDGVYTGTEEMVAYHGETRDRFATFAGRKILITKDTAYLASDTELSALNRTTYPAASLKLYRLRTRLEQMRTDPNRRRPRGSKTPDDELQLSADIRAAEEDLATTVTWKTPCVCNESLILAGDVLFAGGQDQVIAVEARSGKNVWTGKVKGLAKGLAVADGRLIVSTDKGRIYSFGPGRASELASEEEELVSKASTEAVTSGTAKSSDVAAAILQQTQATRGYCLVLGCETGELACELAKRSDLMVYAVTDDPQKLIAVQKRVDREGLLGARVCVEQWPLDKVPYSDYFANLIVSETALLYGTLPPSSTEALRMLKPCGGVLALSPKQPNGPDVAQWLAQANAPEARLTEKAGSWPLVVRGPLAGAGSWTHEYANPANTACGDDQLVKSPLGLLWFGDPGPGRMVNRHERAASPLAMDGRLFIQGRNVVMVYDAYNGVQLWEREIPGAMRSNASHDGSNLALDRAGLFVAAQKKCLRLDPANGETAKTYEMPLDDLGARDRWGYIARSGDLLYGSRSRSGTASDTLFALDAATGQSRWIYRGQQILHNCIAIGDGQVFLIDNDRRGSASPKAPSKSQRRQAGTAASGAASVKEKVPRVPSRAEVSEVRTVVALDAQTGEVRWKERLDLSQCGDGKLAIMYHDGVLVVFGVYLDGHYWQQFFAGEFASRRVVALSGQDGKVLWSQPVGFRVRPLIIGDTLHAEPWAFDLRTGESKTRIHPVTGQPDRWQFARPGHHCGCPCAAPNALFFRSYCVGYYDLAGDSGTYHFGSQRTGCWINFIPAAGLLLVPEASSGCMCPFPNMCTVVFQPARKPKGYSLYSAPGALTPVRHLGINLGAPGDRKDPAGNLWLGYPRPGGSLVLQMKIDVAFQRGGAFVLRNSSFTPVAGTEEPWLFASAARGVAKCVIPLLEPADGTATYRVRLAFCDPDNDQPGKRVFDVKLQGKKVLTDFDIVKESGGRDRAVVKEIEDVEVTDKLTIEFLPKIARAELPQAPILQGVEVVRQRVLSLGCTEPSLVLSDAAPKQTVQLQLSNLRDASFEGTLEIGQVDGFHVSPRQVKVSVASDGRATVPVELSATTGWKPGEYAIPLTLVRADGVQELQRAIRIEYLGPRARITVPAVEDASVSRRYPTLNKGSANVLLVDGGNAKLGDTDHSLAYLRFRFDVPGKVVATRLRIRNAGNPTGNSGRIFRVDEPWSENGVTYATRPQPDRELAQIGAVAENQWVELTLPVDLTGKKGLSLLIDPTSCDGTDYLSRESKSPPELVIEYEP